MPDPKRGEIVNIGIVVYRSSGVDVKLLSTSSKIRMFDGTTSLAELKKLADSIKSICGFDIAPNEQYGRLKSFGTGIFVTDMSSFSILNIGEYETVIDDLFNTLVKPYSPREPRPSNSRFFTRTKNEFRKLKILANSDSDINNHKIVPH